MKRERHLPLRTRLLLGGIAGFVATAAMTSAMRRMHGQLPAKERYPLPPREITERMIGEAGDGATRDAAMLAHFLYGAGSGALLAAVGPGLGPAAGAAGGVAIWTGSYFGWVPAFGILKPANRHPARRNALMIAAHIVWGASTGLVLEELARARAAILNDRPPEDSPRAVSRRREC